MPNMLLPKAGDRVRVIDASGTSFKRGEILTVRNATGGRFPYVYFACDRNFVSGGWDLSRFELVEAVQPQQHKYRIRNDGTGNFGVERAATKWHSFASGLTEREATIIANALNAVEGA